ncbi:unnamed protein product [Amoebophrya sp. A25]|nr:unnamed protein product [Amoebophrya sp. A25]|eukprot:GSA25T00022573001.1
MNDKVRLIARDGNSACSKSERADPTSFTLGTQVSPTRIYNVTTLGGVQIGKQALEYNFGIAARTGSYAVCYCQDYNGCSQNMHFFQEAGTISIAGVSGAQAAQFCFVNEPCSARMIGTLLDAGSRMLLLDGSEKQDSCGKPGKLVTSHHFFRHEQVNFQSPPLFGFRVDTKGNLGNSVDFLDYTLGEPEVITNYIMCYCDHTLTPGAAKACEYQEYFTQFAGYLYVRGVDTRLAMSCEQGGACEFSIVGPVMTAADRIMAIDMVFDDAGSDITPDDKKCGQAHATQVRDGFFQPGSLIAPSNIDLQVVSLGGKSRANYKWTGVVNPGKFRLCFCPGISGSQSHTCDAPAQFHLGLGTVRVQGVISDVQPGILPTNNVVSVKVLEV